MRLCGEFSSLLVVEGAVLLVIKWCFWFFSIRLSSSEYQVLTKVFLWHVAFLNVGTLFYAMFKFWLHHYSLS